MLTIQNIIDKNNGDSRLFDIHSESYPVNDIEEMTYSDDFEHDYEVLEEV